MGVLSEGYAMLRGVSADFKASGHEVAVLLDERIAELNAPLEADSVLPVKSCGVAELAFKAAAQEAEAVLVVAPEADGILQSLVETVEDASALSLNCLASAIGKASNKLALISEARQLGLHVPRTVLLDAANGIDEVEAEARRELEYPFVAKPLWGAGCSGVNLVRNKGHLSMYLQRLMSEGLGARFVAQEFVEGVAASVSLIAARDKAFTVSLNGQNVVLSTPESSSSYAGGAIPLEHPLTLEAFTAAEKLVSSQCGFRGYVGVDMILTEDEPVVVEVNPRLTTSYVGLRKVAPFNVAQAMLNASLTSELPKSAQTHGYTCFSKIAVPNPTPAAFRACSTISEVASPPFPLGENGKSVALVQSLRKTKQAAVVGLQKAEKQLLHTVQGGKLRG
jgi:tyramine---L-glutamate ligase